MYTLHRRNLKDGKILVRQALDERNLLVKRIQDKTEKNINELIYRRFYNRQQLVLSHSLET